MTGGFVPMPVPPPGVPVEAYLPQRAFEQITEADLMTAANRLGFDGPLHWQTSTQDLPSRVPSGSIRLSCTLAEALVLLECVRALVDVASAQEDDEMVMTYAEALAALFDAIDEALKDYD